MYDCGPGLYVTALGEDVTCVGLEFQRTLLKVCQTEMDFWNNKH